jgi:hypothetical protein
MVLVRRRRRLIAAFLAGALVAGGVVLFVSRQRSAPRRKSVAAARASRTDPKTIPIGHVAHFGPIALGLGHTGTPFGKNFWGRPLPASTPLNPNSAMYVREIETDLADGPHVSREGYLQTDGSPPLYVVPAHQPYVHVDTWILQLGQTTGQISTVPWLQRLESNVLAGGVPIPPQAQPSQNNDRTLDIYQPSSGRLWEMWHVGKDANGNWAVQAAGRIDHVSRSDGIFSPHQGTAATEDSLVGVVTRIEELQVGRIDHPIYLALPHASVLNKKVLPINTPRATHGFSWPAINADGSCTDPHCIPEGLRFRLNPKLDVSSLHLTPVARAIAIAAQKYGFIVMNTGPDVDIMLSNPQPYLAAGFANPYMTEFGSAYGSGYSLKVMANFPWHALQALPYNYGISGAAQRDRPSHRRSRARSHR